MDELKVLNGSVTEGDRIAYAANGYGKTPGIRTARVLRVRPADNALDIEVLQSYYGPDPGRKMTIRHPMRVVKVYA